MANGLTEVRPGDLITSDLMNQLFRKIDEMEQRLASLEAGGATGTLLTITAFDPPNQIAVGQELSVFGSGFAFPPTDNQVTVEGVAVTQFRPGSTSTRLRFLVPSPGSPVPSSGRNVTIRVSNSNGSVQRLYRILPPIPVVGNPPEITAVTREDGSSNLRIGQLAIIEGQNFAATATDNTIRFRVDTQGGPVVYPQPGSTLAITSANPEEIRLVVPEIDEVPATGGLSVTIEIIVGAHIPAVRVVNIRRP